MHGSQTIQARPGADTDLGSPQAEPSDSGRVIAVVPAHNEAATVHLALEALAAQSRVPDEIIVVVDNCTDDTAERARSWGARVVVSVDNRDKKAGALNQVLTDLLPTLREEDVVLVQDADSFLDTGFVAGGLRALSVHLRLGAVGGTFRGQAAPEAAGRRERFLAHLQDNEYARWARQVLTAAGVVVTAIYLFTLLWAVFNRSLAVHPFWGSVTGIFVLERFVTLRDKGLRHQSFAALMYELPYELFLQATHAKAYTDALLRKERTW